jgi:hypothetical protein
MKCVICRYGETASGKVTFAATLQHKSQPLFLLRAL